MTNAASKRIAIIGTGISGLGAAHLLHPHHDITVYEKNGYVGGHSRTLDVSLSSGVVPVDTGFIVFNRRNYPLLCRLFQHLDVPVADSCMSFGVTIHNGWLEYATPHPHRLFAQRRNLFRPAFWGMLQDIIRFNRGAKRMLGQTPLSLQDLLTQLGVGEWFQRYFLLAMGGAIWSTPIDQMKAFPADTLIRFFDNHGLLTLFDQPQWLTVRGGSRQYVSRLTAPFQDRIRTHCGACRVWRTEDGVVIQDTQGQEAAYDEVVWACHADQALALMADASPTEQTVLSAFTYQPNRAVLHTDTRLMPRRRQAWASWVYRSDHPIDHSSRMSLTYWMNSLQPLGTDEPVLVTLNPHHDVAPSDAYNEHVFEHPLFDQGAIQAQPILPSIQGVHRYWFCGAYQRYGFHEDGLRSAVEMVANMGIVPPW